MSKEEDEMKTIIYNGILVTMNKNRDVYQNGYVAFEDGKIAGTGPVEELEARYGQR